MGGVLAIFNRDGEPAGTQAIGSMLAGSPYRSVDGQDCWARGNVALAHQHFWVTPEEAGERQPLVDEAAGCAITCDARLDNRPVLGELLDLVPADLADMSDAALVLRAYQKWGRDCAGHLLGDFAFVIWDWRRLELFLARDPLGDRALSFAAGPRRILVASDVDQLLAYPALPARLNEYKVAQFLAGLWFDDESTFYSDVSYCPPGHCLLVSSSDLQTWRYWDADPQATIRYRREEEYADHFRELFREAVRCRLRTVGPVGIALSGGLDSASITAVAAELLSSFPAAQSRLQSFSYVFDELESCDERRYIRPVVERFGIDATYLPGDDKWPLRDLARWSVHRDFITSNAYMWLFLSVLDAAQQAGCRALLLGHFGDNLFAGDHFWLPALVRELRVADVRAEYQGKSARIPEDMLNYGLRPLIPRRLRQAYHRLKWRPMGPDSTAIDPDLVRRTDLVAACNRLLHDDRYKRNPAQLVLYRSLTGALTAQGLASARRRYYRRGLEPLQPFSDRRLVEYMLAIPAHQRGRPSRSKWVLRNAMAGVLPEEVLERRGKTSFHPLFLRGLLEREHQTVQELLAEPEIVKRRFVQPGWLRSQLLAGKDFANGGYDLWLCISLELWLKRYWSA